MIFFLFKVLFQGRAFFSEVSDSLQNLKPIYYGPLGKQCIELSGSLKPFSEIEEMLIQEMFEFEVIMFFNIFLTFSSMILLSPIKHKGKVI